MLRSVKSTQRKIRQIEIILKEESGSLSVSGPASNQVTSATSVSGVISIELKQAFAAEPVIVGNSSKDDGQVEISGSGNKGGSSDKLEVTHSVAGSATDLDDGQIHLLIIGSDVDSKI